MNPLAKNLTTRVFQLLYIYPLISANFREYFLIRED